MAEQFPDPADPGRVTRSDLGDGGHGDLGLSAGVIYTSARTTRSLKYPPCMVSVLRARQPRRRRSHFIKRWRAGRSLIILEDVHCCLLNRRAPGGRRSRQRVRKLIAFDDDTFDKL